MERLRSKASSKPKSPI